MGPSPAETPPRWVWRAQAVAACCLIAGVILEAPRDHWDLPLLLVLVAAAVASDLLSVQSESLLKISGASLALVLSAVLLGGVPAAIVGVLTILVGWLRWREARHYLVNNLLTYACFPFVVGTGFRLVVSLADLRHHDVGFYALIPVAYLSAVVLNFALVVGYQCLLDSRSFLREARRMFVLLVTSELVCAVLTTGIAWLWVNVGIVALALVTVALVAYQHVVAQLVISRERGEQLKHQAVTDALTGLPNRVGFIADTDRALEAARRSGSTVSVMLMDLDSFKEINDALGHHVGDLLLREVGTRLAETVEGRRQVARLGGDEFALVVGDADDAGRRSHQLAREMLAALERPFALGELLLETSASIGIAVFPQDGEDVHTLLQKADVAMYAAKEDGTSVESYSSERNRHSTRRLALTVALRAAVSRGEIELEYHPEVNVRDGSVLGVEALARWHHPTLGQIAPEEFIALAEHTGLIRPLTEQVLDLALADQRSWRAAGSELRMAVNLSARLLSDRRLPDQVMAQLRNAGAPPERLAAEITETMVLRDPARALTTLVRLRELGISLSLDDFGTGYSSMAYLKELPVDEIKVDRSFVQGMLTDAADGVIVRSTVALGRSLELRTIAEGVENEATLRRLRRLGCDVAQGTYFTPPIGAEALLAWMKSGRPAPLAAEPDPLSSLSLPRPPRA